MTEAQLLELVTHECDMLGLLWYHPNYSRRDRRGWPDLVIGGPRGVLFRELKAPGEDLTAEQRRWHWLLHAAGCNWAIWYPYQWDNGLIRGELARLSY